MAGQVKAVTVDRQTHTVVLAGEPAPRADIHIEMDQPGYPKTSRSSYDGLLGEKGFLNLSWGTDLKREQPFVDDPFPMSMPDTIANSNVYGRENRTDGTSPELPLEYMHMSHFFVQEEARRMGYGQIMWDAYVALVAYIDGYASGKVGDSRGRETYKFLKAQGVPERDIEWSEGSAWLGEATVVWETDGSNVVGNAPVTVGTVPEGEYA